DKSGVTAVFEDGSSASGDLLIGADGIHSRVRAQMQPQSRPVYCGYAAWRGILSFPHEQVGAMWGESWGRGLRFGVIPLSRGRVYWFATMNRPASTPPDDHKILLKALFRGWHPPIPELIEATPDEHLLYNDIADLEPLSSWSDNRVTLLGDAAHAMSPNMGQGACQAIEDAVTLAQMMQQQSKVTDAIQAYQADRMPHTRKVVLRSRQIGQMGQLTNLLLIELRNTVIRSIPERMRWQQFDFVLAHGQAAHPPPAIFRHRGFHIRVGSTTETRNAVRTIT
ncbi:MAG: FAD-dependent monooxygenase, partial [Anaerolineae bacterium]|nr:FAD-dependent monooxygenase [Anaerolineae bacterium]